MAPENGNLIFQPKIVRLLADCAHAIDDDRLERWCEYFTEDAVYQIIPRGSYEAGHPLGIMLCEGRGMLRDRVKALRDANIFEPHVYCHLLGIPSMQAEEDGHIRCRTNFQVIRTMENGESSLFATGKYLDRIVYRQGSPMLQDRRVILDSRRVDVLLVYPI